MKLTPLDIRHKEFKRAMRGYADVEVDEFLDEVADEFERVFKENVDLRDRVETLEDQVAGYRRMEETLQKTLISAQASADELKQSSTKEAQLIVHEGELKARQLVNEAYSERQAVEQATARLRSAEQDYRFKFRQLLEGYLKQIEEEEVTPAVGEAAASSDFARQAEAVKQAIEREKAAAPPPAAPVAAGAAAVVVAPPVTGSAASPAKAPSGAPPERDVAADAAASREVAGPGDTAVAGDEAAEEPRIEAPTDSRRMPDLPGPDEVTADRRPELPDRDAVTAERVPDLPGPDEVTAGHIAEYVPPAATPVQTARGVASAPEPERAKPGDTEDLLADVDSEVNENEFKW